MRQLIFVVETNDSSLTDDRYIKKLINYRYDLNNNEFKLQFIHMNGKNNYCNKSIKTKINNLIVMNKKSENYVIYCFDTDKIDSNPIDNEIFNSEKDYCFKNNYKLIWFCYDIEYVLLGHSVESNKKKQESIKYIQNNKITIPVNKLFEKDNIHKGSSNIYNVLDDPLSSIIK